ncbi:glycoside hydrolase family 13 protein [Streptococcus pluranimalium]|uniref:glycoside hydrolase family 13 protein n=1 Tax=Streptococcus pluranimalium TaxID=82348 RepID=UPI003F67807B
MNDKWWKDSVVYQIYPQSFNDTNNDGIGDIKGITEKLDYISDLGADVIWLNPIFESPLIDNGYDISNYYQINPIYGTIDDFKVLISEAHKKNIKIILDIALNHTSEKHIWFQESKKSKNNDFSDFYIWKDPKPDGSEPNNWGASFGGKAWKYVAERNQYYLHVFAEEMPDLNWDNIKVREEVYNILRFWLDLGVDGFRMDTISLYSKDPAFPNASDDVPYAKSYYIGVSNGPNLHKYLREMNEQVFSHYNTLVVGETPNTTVEQALQYTAPERNEIDMVFQFDHMHLDYGKYGKFSDVRFKLSDLKKSLSEWQYGLSEGWNALYWSNHDQPRVVTRFGNELAYREKSSKMLATLLHMLRGTPFIYQGEEIGMKNVPMKNLDDYKDIETLNEINIMRMNNESENYIRKSCYLKSRDNARTPMPWDNSDGYGFSQASPWISYSIDNENINVDLELKKENSIFEYYQRLIRLRKEFPVIVDGKYQLIDKEDSDIFSYIRYNDDEILLIICSFSEEKIGYRVPDNISNYNFELLLSNYSNRKFKEKFVLNPYEALVFYFNKSNH